MRPFNSVLLLIGEPEMVIWEAPDEIAPIGGNWVLASHCVEVLPLVSIEKCFGGGAHQDW